MKKLILLIVLALSTSAVMAQSFYYGPTLGANLSTLTKQSYSQTCFRGNIGAQVGYNLTNIIALHGEVQYSWQGTGYNKSDVKTLLNYLKVPILGRLSVVENFSVEAGLSFNFLMSSKLKNYVAGESVESTTYAGIDAQARKFDLSVPVGVSYLFFDRLELGLRYDVSLCRVWVDSSNKSKNSNLAIALRYRL
ncbi:MAG: porin family protein [Rikenellaceae bacterium]